MKIVVTGASGMLGRATMERLQQMAIGSVVGLCHSRAGDGLRSVDLADLAQIGPLMEELAPDVIIHTAAIRKPDEFSTNENYSRRLNVETTAELARWVGVHPGTFLVYISTDYVFDGTQPPYPVDAQTHPINAYGQSKADGEVAVRQYAATQSAILRVPILYTDKVETLDESSVTNVFKLVLRLGEPGNERYSKSNPIILDDWAVRYPTHVDDVAEILAQIAIKKPIGTWHWSGREPLTKLDMGRLFAERLGFDTRLLVGSGEPANGSAPRPKDCYLDSQALENLGITTLGTPFAVALESLVARRYPSAINNNRT